MAPCHVLQTKAVLTFQNPAFNEEVHGYQASQGNNLLFSATEQMHRESFWSWNQSCKKRFSAILTSLQGAVFSCIQSGRSNGSYMQNGTATGGTLVVHAVTATCLHCKYCLSCREESGRATGRTCHDTCIHNGSFFQLKNRQREPIGPGLKKR